MQVILMLSTDLDGNDDRDKASLDNLLAALIVQLDMQVKNRISLFLNQSSRQLNFL